MFYCVLSFYFLFVVSTIASHPPTIHPHVATTEASNDVFDDNDNDEAVTDGTQHNGINAVDKSNFYQLFTHFSSSTASHFLTFATNF